MKRLEAGYCPPINRLEAALVRLKQMRGGQVRCLNRERNFLRMAGSSPPLNNPK
jgi:hypothetical protein